MEQEGRRNREGSGRNWKEPERTGRNWKEPERTGRNRKAAEGTGKERQLQPEGTGRNRNWNRKVLEEIERKRNWNRKEPQLELEGTRNREGTGRNGKELDGTAIGTGRNKEPEGTGRNRMYQIVPAGGTKERDKTRTNGENMRKPN